MALLTENRNRIPLVVSAPVDAQTEGKTGDLLMVATGINGGSPPLSAAPEIYVCVVGDVAVGSPPIASGAVWNKMVTVAT